MNIKSFKPFTRLVMFLLFLLMTGMLTACGDKKAEPVDTQLGIDGYVYLPTKLSDQAVSNFFISGDYLYYRENSSICRMKMVPEEGADNPEMVPDFSTGETLVHLESSMFGQDTEKYPRESDIPVYNDMRERILDTGMARYSFYLTSYFAVDGEQNLYYYIEADAGDLLDYESGDFPIDLIPADLNSIGGMLYKQTADGQIVYSLFLPSLSGLAADQEQRLYALTNEGIYILDASGRQLNIINIDGYVEESSLGTYMGRLLANPQGQIYYIARPKHSIIVLEADSSDPARLREIPAFTGKIITNVSVSPDGNLMFFDSGHDMLYEYNRETSEINAVLRWEDINYHGDNFAQVVRLSPDRLLAKYEGNNTQALFLLDKTPVDQLPQKELVVLASLSPTDEIRDSVILFNQQSSQYHVVIETYGSDLLSDDREPLLDATLVSSTPPDLLDLHDVYKYADRDALEDLTPYLAASSQVPLEDYLDAVIEGYTINGKLVCVPTQFSIFLVAGRASQLDALGLEGGWTMEDAYALTEKYPDSMILHSLTNTGADEKSRTLERFCSTWILEKFVDWDTGICYFDSEEFRQMVTWLDGHSGKHTEVPPDPAIGVTIVEPTYMPEDALLNMPGFSDFTVDLVSLEYKFKEDVRLLGIPTADGRNRGLIFVHDALGITSNARNKEGAWAFLEYFLSKDKILGMGNYLPTRKSQLNTMFSSAITPPPIDELTGEYLLGNTRSYYWVKDEEPHLYYYTPERLARELLTAIESADFTPLPDEADQILDIVLEEMDSYYNGDKGIEQVTEIIQNRAQLLLDEHGK